MAQQDSEFAGKRVLVTGGTRGIGAAISARLAAAGATVFATARSAPTESTPLGVSFLQADVATADGVSEVARLLLEEGRGVDILIHNVGASFSKPGGVLALSGAVGSSAAPGDARTKVGRHHSHVERRVAPARSIGSGVWRRQSRAHQLQ
jgi:NAD(P)-dependent dehydrogenase (short-subunit alcohol dehydrogenase family)